MNSEWVIAISAAVTGIATAVIAWYTKVNKDLLGVQKELLTSQRMAEKNAKSPILVLIKPVGAEGKRGESNLTWWPKLLIKNVGIGPALNVKYLNKGVHKGVQPLGTAEEQSVNLEARVGDPFTLSDEVTIQYEDLFARKWETIVAVNLEHRIVSPS